MKANLDGVRPVGNEHAAAHLKTLNERRLQFRVNRLAADIHSSAGEDAVVSHTRRRTVHGVFVVRISSGRPDHVPDVFLIGEGSTKRDALLDLLLSQLNDEDEDDDRTELAPEFEPGEVASC